MFEQLRKFFTAAGDVMEGHQAASSVGYRLISTAISIVFFGLFSQVVFLLFMGDEGFFSYDLLLNGSLGVNVFFLTTEFALLLFAVVVFGALIPLFSKFFRGSVDRKGLVWLLPINVFMWLSVVPAVFRSWDQGGMLWVTIAALSILVCAQVAAVVYGSAKRSLRALVIVLLCVSGITFVAHDYVASLLKIGFQYFGVGGDIPVMIEIDRPSGLEKLKGRLVFMSPENIYVVLAGDADLSIISRSKAEIIGVSSR